MGWELLKDLSGMPFGKRRYVVRLAREISKKSGHPSNFAVQYLSVSDAGDPIVYAEVHRILRYERSKRVRWWRVLKRAVFQFGRN